MMTDYATYLANKGFVVLMPHYFGGTKLADFSQISTYQATLADAIAYSKTLPSLDSASIGLLGFSLGGYICLRNRSLAKVLVEYFAPLFPDIGGIGVSGNSSLHAQIHHGEVDELLSLTANAKPIVQQLNSEGTDVELFSYKDAGHGFSGKKAGDIKAQIEAKARTLAFFKKYL